MKLTPQDIQFIDTYLLKHDIIFVDVRAEMVDHIATAVEEKMQKENVYFYDAFKDYMAVNNKELYKNNKENRFKAYLIFAKTLLKPYNIIIAIMCLVVCFMFQNNIQDFTFIYWIFLLFYLIISSAIYFLNSRKRYYVLEQTSYVLNIIYFINLFINGNGRFFYGNYVSVALVTFLTIAFFINYIKTIIKFNKTNKMLFAK